MIVQSGVELAFPADRETHALFAACEPLAAACDELVPGREPDSGVVCTFAFESEAGPLGVVVRRLPPDALATRGELGGLLGAPVAGVVRVDSLVRAASPDETVRVERLLTSVAALLCTRFGGVARDDLGAVYDGAELSRLARAGRTIVESDVFRDRLAALAAGDGYGASANGAVAAPVLGSPPADARPDLSTATGIAFLTIGERLPLLAGTRIFLATRGAIGGNPDRLPVIVLAPVLAAGDRAVLAGAGAVCVDDPDALFAALAPEVGEPAGSTPAPVRATRERDEICAYFSDASVGAVAELLDRRALDVALAAGGGSGDGPVLVHVDLADAASDLPHAVARFGFDGALASFYRLDLARAHPFVRSLIEARGDVTTILGGAVRHALICELVADPDVPHAKRRAALDRADAFAVSIFAELATRDDAAISDATGAVYPASELMRLAAARLGRGAAWSRRVALAETGAR